MLAEVCWPLSLEGTANKRNTSSFLLGVWGSRTCLCFCHRDFPLQKTHVQLSHGPQVCAAPCSRKLKECIQKLSLSLPSRMPRVAVPSLLPRTPPGSISLPITAMETVSPPPPALQPCPASHPQTPHSPPSPPFPSACPPLPVSFCLSRTDTVVSAGFPPNLPPPLSDVRAAEENVREDSKLDTSGCAVGRVGSGRSFAPNVPSLPPSS